MSRPPVQPHGPGVKASQETMKWLGFVPYPDNPELYICPPWLQCAKCRQLDILCLIPPLQCCRVIVDGCTFAWMRTSCRRCTTAKHRPCTYHKHKQRYALDLNQPLQSKRLRLVVQIQVTRTRKVKKTGEPSTSLSNNRPDKAPTASTSAANKRRTSSLSPLDSDDERDPTWSPPRRLLPPRQSAAQNPPPTAAANGINNNSDVKPNLVPGPPPSASTARPNNVSDSKHASKRPRVDTTAAQDQTRSVLPDIDWIEISDNSDDDDDMPQVIDAPVPDPPEVHSLLSPSIEHEAPLDLADVGKLSIKGGNILHTVVAAYCSLLACTDRGYVHLPPSTLTVDGNRAAWKGNTPLKFSTLPHTVVHPILVDGHWWMMVLWPLMHEHLIYTTSASRTTSTSTAETTEARHKTVQKVIQKRTIELFNKHGPTDGEPEPDESWGSTKFLLGPKDENGGNGGVQILALARVVFETRSTVANFQLKACSTVVGKRLITDLVRQRLGEEFDAYAVGELGY